MLGILTPTVLLASLWTLSVAGQVSLDGRIVGGHATTIMRHQHQVSLRQKTCETCAFSHRCGGTIYSANVIVTAAHCVYKRSASTFVIVAGTNGRYGSDGVIAKVEQIVVHEQFNAMYTENDLALIWLATPLPINNVTISTVALAAQPPGDGEIGVVTGWGATSENGFPSVELLAVDLTVVSNTQCSLAYGDDRITDAMLCAATAGGGKDPCKGDSGGPMIVNQQLAGIVSWGLGCGRPNYPGVYTNVAHFKDWIESTIKGKKNT